MYEILRPFLEDARRNYLEKVSKIKASSGRIRAIKRLVDELSECLPGCTVESRDDYANTSVITIVLVDPFSIEKDINLLLERFSEQFSEVGRGELISSTVDFACNSYDVYWPNLVMFVYFFGTTCKKVQVGTETIEKPVYRLECS